MKQISGGVTAAKGFSANGMSAGIKKSGKPDLALIYADKPASAAAVFTKNSVKAAPVLVCQKNIRGGKIQALVVNSGNANCFTGHFGMIYARQTTEVFGKLLNVRPSQILVASTGIIGRPLPFENIKRNAPALVDGLSAKGGIKVAEAIMTTDLALKEIAVEVMIAGKKVVIGGCAKGSGMIQPNMATMLGFVTTDANITPVMLKAALKEATDQSFNCITVDGCMSTNDMVSVMASGLAGHPLIAKKDKHYEAFVKALHHVCMDLAMKIVLDGEGATKLIEVRVKGAKTIKQAKAASMSVANSNLVKTAAYGDNPNWGRVAAAVGSLGIKSISEKTLKLNFDLTEKHVKIYLDLNQGNESAVAYTCDLTEEYVKINGKYN